MDFQKICVLGLGYIGLPTASTFATRGLQVLGVDINPQVLETQAFQAKLSRLAQRQGQ